MISIDDDKHTIRLTRGDSTGEFYRIAVKFPIYNFETEEEEDYEFQLDDEITFSVYPKKGYRKPPIFRKSFTLEDIGYTEPSTTVEIPLTAQETKTFELLNKPKTYWYDIVLNDSTTVLGYDGEGAKVIIVYPEAEE